MNSETVVKICGEYPYGFVKEDIESNPNFIFTNDLNYQGVKVWDKDGNFVFVNSFQECEHYVSGGWDEDPIKSKESNLQYSLSVLILGVLIFQYLYKKIFVIQKK
tara:strand:- start:242 stop:556 length:315 start_codon:yes stop_codon:yes gene_type:complete